MEQIRIFQEMCAEHGPIRFIEYLPEKTLLSQESIDENSSWMYLADYTLTILAENGVAVYELTPLPDGETYYGQFVDWHLYEPAIVRHLD